MSVFVSSSHLDHAVPCFYLVIKLSTVKPLGRCVNRIEVTAALGPAFSITEGITASITAAGSGRHVPALLIADKR